MPWTLREIALSELASWSCWVREDAFKSEELPLLAFLLLLGLQTLDALLFFLQLRHVAIVLLHIYGWQISNLHLLWLLLIVVVRLAFLLGC